MKPKILLLSILVLVILTNCQQSIPIRQIDNANAEKLIPKIVQSVQDNHFKPRIINDELSKDMVSFFINHLDPQKEFFTQKDINRLNTYQLTLDEAIVNNNFEFFNTAISLLENGISKAENYSNHFLNGSTDFSTKENLEINFSILPYASNDKALKDRWRKKLKKYILDQHYVEEKMNPSMSTEVLLKNANEKVRKLLSLKLEKLKNTTDKRHIEDYANAFLKVHDFQTQYFSPKQKSAWESSYTRSFVGIGVRLELENGYPKITETHIGGPVWKTKSIQVGDVILKIKGKDGVSIDLIGKSMDEIISRIKGERGSVVTLMIKDKTANIREVTVVRDKVDFDQATAFLLEDKTAKQKIGYVRLPRFYGGNPGCATHVFNEIETLKSNKVDGIIFDLRNNFGGSSGECRALMDYFLNDGMCMQTKRAEEAINEYYNENSVAQYDGKLLVLTNARSGSASELFSGTMQDYKRALIVGGTSTFGKGTMQGFTDLNESENSDTKFGEIKMTVGLFYTASGRSPQSTGIIPDIILPDDSKYVSLGEKSKPFSLPPDALQRTVVSQEINVVENIKSLRSKSEQRVKANEKFQMADKKARHLLSLENNNLVELNFDDYKQQKDAAVNLEKEWDTIFTEINDFNVSIDKTAFTQDSTAIIKRERLIKQIKSDPYIYECYQIINDMAG